MKSFSAARFRFSKAHTGAKAVALAAAFLFGAQQSNAQQRTPAAKSDIEMSQRENLGPTYEIVEPDMLEQIQKKLRSMEASGRMAQKIEEAKARAIRSIENPIPVRGLGRSMTNRTYYFDPSIKAEEDIKDPSGQIIVKAGTMVNPFDYAAMNQWLLFFDGSDPKQVALAEKIGEKYQWELKPIMVKGPPLEISRKWTRQVFFDQGGYLVRKLGIQNVPALVTQEGKEMRIDELRY
jgi:conjugal transfer pilus assembly protein TraW